MTTTSITLKEEDLIKIMLDFLSSRNYFVTMRTLEKESGVVNCEYSDDLLFLRELVLDGDWDEIMAFAEPFQNMDEFDTKRFKYFVLKQKFLEFLSMKSHVVDKGNNSGSVEEVLKTLHALEETCSSKEEYSNLCWLLTVPNLKDRPEFKGWTLDNSRMTCFYNILDVVGNVFPSKAHIDPNKTVSEHDRLLQLITKGILYESCTDYCQSAATGKPNDISYNLNVNLTHGTDEFMSANLLSWLRTLDMGDFTRPFEQIPLDILLKSTKRPHGVTQSLDEPLSTIKSKIEHPVSKSLADIDVAKPTTDTSIRRTPAQHHIEIRKKSFIKSQISKPQNITKDTNQNITDRVNLSRQNKSNPHKNIINANVQNDREEITKSISIADMKESQQFHVSKTLEKHEENRRLMQQELIGQPASQITNKETEIPQDPPLIRSNESKVSNRKQDAPEMLQERIEKSLPNPGLSSSTKSFSKSSTDSSSTKVEIRNRIPPKAITKEHVGPATLDLKDGSGRISVSTPKPSDRKPTKYEESLETPVSSIGHEGSSTTENSIPQNKENISDERSALLGPKINGVRIPLAKATPLNIPVNEDAYPQPVSEIATSELNVKEEIIVGSLEANGKSKLQKSSNSPPSSHPGPKIKTRDGSKVLVADLLKSREEIKNVSATISTRSPSSHPRHQQDNRCHFNPIARLSDVQAIRAASFHPNGEIVAIGSNSKTLRICAYPKQQDYMEGHLSEMEVLHQRGKYHKGSIYCCAWTPRGDLLATGSNDKSIKLLTFDSVQSLSTSYEVDVNIHTGTVRELAFVPSRAAMLVSGGAGNGSIPVTDCTTNQNVGYLLGHSSNVLTVFAGEGDIIATGSSDNTIRLWDLRSRRCIDLIMVGESPPASVALNGSGSLLAAGQEDGCMILYDLSAGRTLQSFRSHQEDCRSVRFSRDSRLLLTGSYDKTINLLHCDGNLELNSPLQYTIGEHADKVIQCRWHPTQSSFISSSADKTSIIWQMS